jgi:hypothetical protein
MRLWRGLIGAGVVMFTVVAGLAVGLYDGPGVTAPVGCASQLAPRLGPVPTHLRRTSFCTLLPCSWQSR